MPKDLQLWLDAVRGLRDNPLAVAWQRAQRRKYMHTPWYKRGWVHAVLIALAVLALAHLVSDRALFSPQVWDDPWLLFSAAAAVLISAYVVWAAHGLVQAFSDALQVLAQPSRRLSHLMLDDACATTLLDDRQVVSAAVAVLLPPLFVRILTGAFLVWLLIAGIVFLDDAAGSADLLSMFQDSISVANVWFMGPLTVAVITLTGVLAAVCLLLYSIVLSRGLPAVFASPAAVLLLLVQGAHILASFLISPLLMGDATFSAGSQEDQMLSWALLITAPVIYMLFGVVLEQCQRSLSARRVFSAGAPVFAVLLPIAVMTAAALLSGANSSILEPLSIGMLGYFHNMGALSLVNTLALPTGLCWGAGEFGSAQSYHGLFQFPLLLALQLALLSLSARHAVFAVKLRRQAAE